MTSSCFDVVAAQSVAFHRSHLDFQSREEKYLSFQTSSYVLFCRHFIMAVAVVVRRVRTVAAGALILIPVDALEINACHCKWDKTVRDTGDNGGDDVRVGKKKRKC